jgi:hypothetical protein
MKSIKSITPCNKYLPAFFFTLLFSGLLIPALTGTSGGSLLADSGNGLITGSSVLMREKPDRKSKIVYQFSIYDSVEIIEESDEPEEINNMSAGWLRVKIADTEGWCYGGFVARQFESNKNGSVTLWKTDCSYDVIIIHHKTAKKFLKIEINDPIAGAVPSKSFKFLAVDIGNDSVRTLKIYDINSGKQAFESAYINTELVWKGEKFSFKQVTHSGICCAIYEVAFFENGKVKKTGKKGKASTDCVDPDEEDDTCRKFKVK